MLNFDKLDKIKQESVRRACAYLFTPQLAKNDGFITNLKMDSVKSAFRQKAKRYHPDLHQNEPDDMILKRRERFIKIRESYSVLLYSLFEDSPPVQERRDPVQERKTQERRHHARGDVQARAPRPRHPGPARDRGVRPQGARKGLGPG